MSLTSSPDPLPVASAAGWPPLIDFTPGLAGQPAEVGTRDGVTVRIAWSGSWLRPTALYSHVEDAPGPRWRMFRADATSP